MQQKMSDHGLDISEIHKTHMRWRSEDAAWMGDVENWQREQEKAIAMLYKLERALPDHRSLLRAHGESIKAHEKQLDTHEKTLSELAAGNRSAESCASVLQTHREAEKSHALMLEKHEALRKTQLAAMAELLRLTRLLETP